LKRIIAIEPTMTVRSLPMALNFPVTGPGQLSRITQSYGYQTFAEVAWAICALPYGRVWDSEDIAAVLKEQKGTCSSKHRFLAALAHECGRTEVHLMVGLYEMSEANTPGVGPALGELSAIPEAHCYLMFEGIRFDFTGLTAGVASPFDSLIEERVVSEGGLPSQKLIYHRQVIDAWARDRGFNPEIVWEKREKCIALLAKSTRLCGGA
jgi:hypothetical protein